MQSTNSSVEIPEKAAVIRTDTSKPIGLVSTRYKLLKHSDVVEGMRSALGDIGFEERVSVMGDGAHMYAKYLLPKVEGEVQKGDVVRLQFTAMNSYDGSNSLKIALGALRLVCTNGMVAERRFFSFSQRHVGNENAVISQEILRGKVQVVIARFQEILPKFKRMAETPIGNVATEALFDKERITLPEYLLRAAQEEYLRAGDNSEWGYYNSLTWAVSHAMKKESPAAEVNYGRVAWAAAQNVPA